MPHNTQVNRILRVLRRLESPQGASLHELAAALPEDYPKNLRTIQRDLEALEGLHIPLVTERADGQTRWKLMRWILGWRAAAEVMEPGRLRREIAAEARKIAARG